MRFITLKKRVDDLIHTYGSLRAVGRNVGVDVAYLHRLASGQKLNPSEKTLNKLGLHKTVNYKVDT